MTIKRWTTLARLVAELAVIALGLVLTHDIVKLHQAPALAAVVHADALVALGGDDGLRARHALALYARGVAPSILLLAADSPKGPGGAHYPDLRGDLLERGGVPADRIRYDTRPANTWQEALVTRAWAQACGWQRVVVVTDASHTARAQWAMRALTITTEVAIETVAAPRPNAVGRESGSTANGTPTTAIWHELQKLWYYRLVYTFNRCARDSNCLPLPPARIDCP